MNAGPEVFLRWSQRMRVQAHTFYMSPGENLQVDVSVFTPQVNIFRPVVYN